MDIVFGAVSANDRAANIARYEQGAYFFQKFPVKLYLSKMTEIANVGAHADLERAGSIDDKGDES
jgi:hypothetical protein